MDDRSGCIATTSRWSALSLAFVVVIFLPITIVVHNVVAILLSPELLTDVLIENLIHSGMIQREVATNLLAPELLGDEGSEQFEFTEAFTHLSEAERVGLVEIITPPEWLEAQVREIVFELSRWFTNDEPRPQITLDHRPIKESLMQGGAERLVELIVDSWPSCSLQQVEQMQNQNMQTGQVPILYCEPPEPTRTHMSNYLVGQIERFARVLPARVPLTPEGGEIVVPERSVRWKGQLRSLYAFGRSAWMIPFSFLGFIMAVTVRSWQDLTRWWGRIFLISGVLTFLAGVLTVGAVERILPSAFSQLRAEARFAFDVLQVAVQALSSAVFDSTAERAVLLVLMGAILLFVYWLLKRRQGAQRGRDSEPMVDAMEDSGGSGERLDHPPSSVPPLSRG